LEDGSLLFRTADHDLSVIISALGLIGALVQIRVGRSKTSRFALAMLILAGGIYSLSLAWRFASWSGPIPIYFEYVLWPIYPMFAIFLFARIARSCWRYLSPYLRFPRYWLGIILPLLAALLLHGANAALRGAHNSRPNVYPPTSTVLTEFLRSQVAVAVGLPFRGRVATMTGQTLRTAGWQEMFTLDLDLVRSVGNEHRSIGLWYYNIPTVFVFSHTISPMFYALTKRYLACDGDHQFRAVLNLRCPNIQVLRLLGVSYLLTDGAQGAGDTERAAEMSLPGDKGALAIDRILQPNLGWSPTEIVTLQSGSAALEWLGRSDTNLERQAVSTNPDWGGLVPASNIAITIERDGLSVRAESIGRSLVIVPFEYSRCWAAIARNGTSLPELRRVDFLLMGLLFEGKLDTTIQYKLTPFRQQHCRLRDFKDHISLLREVTLARQTTR
jgi:hypothetical protein